MAGSIYLFKDIVNNELATGGKHGCTTETGTGSAGQEA
jgi:hypothetical protein